MQDRLGLGHIEGKEYRTNGVRPDDIAVIGDSHHSYNMGYWEKHGAFCMAIRGGGLVHAERAVRSIKSKCFLLLIGGNDVSKMGGEGMLDRMGDVVSELTRRHDTEIVITGSLIPRAGKEKLVREMQFANGYMNKVHTKHHHFMFTTFQTNNTIRDELYIRDGTHLNEYGLKVHRQILDWVVGCVNLRAFEGQMELEVDGEGDAVWWEF